VYVAQSWTVWGCAHTARWLTFRHRSFTFHPNKSPTWSNSFSVYYSDVCLQLNMFRAFSHPSSGAQWLQWRPLVLPSYRGDSRAVFVVGPAGPTMNTQHVYHHDTKVKPDAATAVIELLMMDWKTPEICWSLNKRRDNKLENCYIWLVIYLNHTSNLIEILSAYLDLRDLRVSRRYGRCMDSWVERDERTHLLYQTLRSNANAFTKALLLPLSCAVYIQSQTHDHPGYDQAKLLPKFR
jgi:hypothetical protein